MELDSSVMDSTNHLNESYTSHLENLLQYHINEMGGASSCESSTTSAQTSPLHPEEALEVEQKPSTSGGVLGNVNLMSAFAAAAAATQQQASTSEGLPQGFDFSKLFQAFDPQAAASAITTLLASSNSAIISPNTTVKAALKKVADGSKPEKAYKPRTARMKVFAEGFFMTFDKESSCREKNFWRCERKNECPARMHTKVNDLKILKRIHPHNHPEPSEAELSFYNLTTADIVPGQAIPVNSISRNLFKCRRLSRLMSEASSSQEAQNANKTLENQAIIAQLNRPMTVKRESSEEGSDENDLSPIAKRQKLSDIERLMNDNPNFEEILEVSKKLIGFINSLKNEPLLIYISHEEGSIVYKAVELERRTERCLIEKLQNLTGLQCHSSNIQLIVSPRIHVVVHDTMIANWSQGQYFQLRALPQSTWKLEAVEVD